jgi:hypothetical protein
MKGKAKFMIGAADGPDGTDENSPLITFGKWTLTLPLQVMIN